MVEDFALEDAKHRSGSGSLRAQVRTNRSARPHRCTHGAEILTSSRERGVLRTQMRARKYPWRAQEKRNRISGATLRSWVWLLLWVAVARSLPKRSKQIQQVRYSARRLVEGICIFPSASRLQKTAEIAMGYTGLHTDTGRTRGVATGLIRAWQPIPA